MTDSNIPNMLKLLSISNLSFACLAHHHQQSYLEPAFFHCFRFPLDVETPQVALEFKKDNPIGGSKVEGPGSTRH